jgi:hypothetical protein
MEEGRIQPVRRVGGKGFSEKPQGPERSLRGLCDMSGSTWLERGMADRQVKKGGWVLGGHIKDLWQYRSEILSRACTD